MANMKYAIYLPNFGLGGDARTLSDIASEIEESGWDGFFLWDHIQWPNVEPCVDPWVALAAIAMRTERIAIGTMITPVPRRDIAKLARETISVDRLSEGRLILGVGLGWHTIPEWSGFGHETDLRKRGEMLDEGLEVLAALWSGEPVNHAGTCYQIKCDGFGRPAQSPRIPIWVGGTWPSTKPFRRAAKWDGVMPISKKALEGGRLELDDLAEIMKLVKSAGSHAENYVLAITGSTKDASDNATADAYAKAGANWWIESGLAFMTSLDDLFARIRKGPPRIPARGPQGET